MLRTPCFWKKLPFGTIPWIFKPSKKPPRSLIQKLSEIRSRISWPKWTFVSDVWNKWPKQKVENVEGTKNRNGFTTVSISNLINLVILRSINCRSGPCLQHNLGRVHGTAYLEARDYGSYLCSGLNYSNSAIFVRVWNIFCFLDT